MCSFAPQSFQTPSPPFFLLPRKTLSKCVIGVNKSGEESEANSRNCQLLLAQCPSTQQAIYMSSWVSTLNVLLSGC